MSAQHGDCVGGKLILRRPRFVFGGFTRKPARVSSTDRSTRRVASSRSMSAHCSPSSSPRLMPVDKRQRGDRMEGVAL